MVPISHGQLSDESVYYLLGVLPVSYGLMACRWRYADIRGARSEMLEFGDAHPAMGMLTEKTHEQEVATSTTDLRTWALIIVGLSPLLIMTVAHLLGVF